jgi:hypothetical protein
MANDFDFSRFAVGGATRPDSFTGMQPALRNGLAQMYANAPPEIQANLRTTSGYRSVARQAELYAAALQKYGSPEAARKWVAPPGRSQHNHGSASDFKFLNNAARQYAHENAAKYGLVFPLANEDWHVEAIGARSRPGPTIENAAQLQPGQMGPRISNLPNAPIGDFMAPPEVAFAPPTAGSAIGDFLAREQQKKQADAEAQAAEQARRNALFGGDDLASMYG